MNTVAAYRVFVGVFRQFYLDSKTLFLYYPTLGWNSLENNMANTENPSILARLDRINEVDHNLIKQCIDDNRRAWDTFFSLVGPFIGWTIRKTLLAKNDSSNNNEEFIDAIFIQVVEELYGRQRLAAIKSVGGLKPYLRQVVRNKINDWYRTNLSREHIATTVANEGVLSLSGGEGNAIPVNFIGDSEHAPGRLPAGDRQDLLLKMIADQWSTMLDSYDQWFLRLKAMYYVPLNNSEVETIADFSRQSPDDIRQLAGEITQRLAAKEAAYNKNREQAVTLMTIQGRLLAKLHQDLKKGILSRDEAEQRQQEIETIAARKTEKIKKGNLPVAPSTREILQLLNPRVTDIKAEERKLNTRLSRARQRLSKTLKFVRD